MRNGETAWSSPVADVNAAKVVHLMLGVSAGEGRIREPIAAENESLLRVMGLSPALGPLKEINFKIRGG